MSIVFKGSKSPSLGVEIEVQVLNRESKDLHPGAIELIETFKSDKKMRVKSEFTQAMVELNTPICKTVEEVGKSLHYQLEKLRAAANTKGLEIAVSGTHPFQDWRKRSIYPTERYQQILEKYQWLARRLTIFGLHVHVGVKDGDRAIHAMNGLLRYIPHLLALSASSPFWGGRDTGMASVRSAVFQAMPTAGMPLNFADWDAFQHYFEFLQKRGSVNSLRDIYWDVRPHFELGTVEVRACDGLSTLEETLALTAMIQCLAVAIDRDYRPEKSKDYKKRFWMAPENKWQATRYGLDGKIMLEENTGRRLLRDEVGDLPDILNPIAKELKCEKELGNIRSILEKGNSANRQRHVFARTHSLQAVVEAMIEELIS